TAASVFLAAALAIVAWNPLREDADGSALVLADGGLQDLMSRSRTLEAQLPARGLGAAQFTGNSSQQALMYRIADIDSELTRQYEAPRPDLARCETLWSQRVMLLESLADVQRGQAVVRPAVY
ncbi:MAG: hypothetical protein OES38_21945, partial [Gammaproteobacteria bacterium]|nr:hypothetical protein [Gammaproteobacteria bacterium]